MRGGSAMGKTTNLSSESFTELLARVASDSATLVREEVALAKQEFKEKMAALRNGAIMVAIGTILVLLAFVALLAALIIWLTTYMDAATAALITAGGLVLVGAIIAFIGIMLLKKTTSEPIKTVEAITGEDEGWVK
jgi:uncharacterized membrane protein YqjE